MSTKYAHESAEQLWTEAFIDPDTGAQKYGVGGFGEQSVFTSGRLSRKQVKALRKMLKEHMKRLGPED